MSAASSPPGAANGALAELMVRISTTPAPTGSERARGELIRSLWEGAGLNPRFDEVGNVIATLEAEGSSGAPRLLVACHLDSVFASEVNLSVTRGEERWSGAGLGDNAASLAVLTHWLAERGAGPWPHLTLAATVGEEGLGDLRGARHLVSELGEQHDAFIALDGYLGTVVNVPVGSRRYEAHLRAAGGHSWGDYPAPSATHAAGAAVGRLAALHVPQEPRSSLNVGIIWGGSSINAIAEEAGFNLDLRSVDAAALERLEDAALSAVRRAAEEHGVQLELEKVGDRPTGAVDNRGLVSVAVEAYERAGVKPRTTAGSTDANAAGLASLPAISFGVYRGGNAHRLDEWVEPASLEVGVRAWREFVAGLARWQPSEGRLSRSALGS